MFTHADYACICSDVCQLEVITDNGQVDRLSCVILQTFCADVGRCLAMLTMCVTVLIHVGLEAITDTGQVGRLSCVILQTFCTDVGRCLSMLTMPVSVCTSSHLINQLH